MLSLPDTEVVSAPEGEETAALAALNADPDVRYAVPDVVVHVADTSDIPGESGVVKPNDLFFDAQWNLANANDADIDAPQAWAASNEGAGVTVAVADQIVDPNHPDLRDNIAPGAHDFTEANGCTEPTPTGLADHGTHVAGIIAAERDNTIGIVGVAPRAHVLPLRVIDNCGNGRTSWIIAAFDYAGDHGIPIVSASFGTDPWLDVSEKADINNMFAEVLADHPDTLYVVAAGNEGNNNAENPIYPCNTRTRTDPENLICVGMTNSNDVPVCSGNVGDGTVDVYAPGIQIWSTVGPNGYLRLSGTSMSTPMVAGAAAMLASQDLGCVLPARAQGGGDLDVRSDRGSCPRAPGA